MQSFRIIALCVAATVLYGIAHDQITARICVEYFTFGHPPIVDSEDPTILGLVWGVVATWWVGLFLGIALAVAARGGNRPKRDAATLVRPVAILMLATGIGAAVAGCLGWLAAREGLIEVADPLSNYLPRESHVPFLVDLWAHSASYLVGVVGGLVVIGRVRRSRKRQVLSEFRA